MSRSSAPIAVLKFGSSVLADEASLPGVVQEVYRWYRAGWRVIAVVSALGGTTDELIRRARSFAERPDENAQAALLATGELTTVALLGLALDRAGLPASTLDSAGIGLKTRGGILDSSPVGLDTAAIQSALSRRPVLVVPGFIGRNDRGETTLLGRGGSDLTALFIADALGAKECRLVKDVDALYDRDPARDPRARRFAEVSYDDVLALDEGVVQHKAVRFSRDHRLAFTVATLGAERGTRVGPGPSTFAGQTQGVRPLRVGIAGLGTVGTGVLTLLSQRPDLANIVGIAVRDRTKLRDANVPPGAITSDAATLLDRDIDVLIEATGGVEPAASLLAAALTRGVHVITANKAAVAGAWDRLNAASARSGATLRTGACVGGGAPIIEAVALAQASGGVERIDAVLNGTTNFILERLAEGLAFDDAVWGAQERGFAEADPSDDLDGVDAARKLVVLARLALNASLPLESVKRSGIRAVEPRDVARAAKEGGAVRLVASLIREGEGWVAGVGPQRVASGHPLAALKDEWNGAVIRSRDGTERVVTGKGAGRWPTAESIVADFHDLVRTLRAPSAAIQESAA
jgi:homoserine dehydrogenase